MTIEDINRICRGTFVEHLAIEFLNYGEAFVEARMPVDAKKIQPMGLLHGGAALALAETVASCGSFLLVDRDKYSVLGLQVTGNHIATMGEGNLIARAEIIHKGRSTHVWDVKLVSDKGVLISVARVTNSIIEKNKRDRL